MHALIASYPLQPVNVVQAIFFVMSLFCALLLWSNTRFRGICLLLLLEALLMALNFYEETHVTEQVHLVTPALMFATGPAFYLFVSHLVYADHRWHSRQLWHFAPVLVVLPFTGYVQSVLMLGSLTLLVYGFMAFMKVLKYQRAVTAMSSDKDEQALNWLLVVLLVFAILGMTDLIRVNVQPVIDYTLRNTWYLGHQSAVLLTFMAMVFLAIRQPALFSQLRDYEQHMQPDHGDEEILQAHVFADIDARVRDTDLYRTPRLTLMDVAEKTRFGVREVSRAINRASGKNFSDYINGLRIAWILEQIHSGRHQSLPILQLATDAGFNAKTSFNKAFRQVTGTTPREYIKRQTVS